jgi:hypothetical protein
MNEVCELVIGLPVKQVVISDRVHGETRGNPGVVLQERYSEMFEVSIHVPQLLKELKSNMAAGLQTGNGKRPLLRLTLYHLTSVTIFFHEVSRMAHIVKWTLNHVHTYRKPTKILPVSFDCTGDNRYYNISFLSVDLLTMFLNSCIGCSWVHLSLVNNILTLNTTCELGNIFIEKKICGQYSSHIYDTTISLKFMKIMSPVSLRQKVSSLLIPTYRDQHLVYAVPCGDTSMQLVLFDRPGINDMSI